MTKQMRDLLDQLKSALHSSSKVLTQTGNVMGQVDQKLQKIVTDLQTLQNSDMYQNILSLEKIDAKDISDFMSSPVNIKTDVLYEVENYGTGMTPFYTNLALWVGGLILVSILKQEVDRDKEVPDFTPTSAYFGRNSAVSYHRTDSGSYRMCGRYYSAESTVSASGKIYSCRNVNFLCLCESDLCTGIDVKHMGKHWRFSGNFTDSGFFRNVSD